jgi:hypothetical protein
MVLVALVAIILSLDSIPSGRACGEFRLLIDLEVPAGRKVVSVASHSQINVGLAEDYLRWWGGTLPDDCFAGASWTEGHPIPVRVPCGGMTSLLSDSLIRRWQYHAIMVRLDYADGTSQTVVREIPEVRGHQERMTIAVP